MRYTSLIVLLAFATTLTAQEFRKVFSLGNTPEPVVRNIVRYDNATKSLERIYINSDYCSYVVVRKGARYYNAAPGENVVESRQVQSQAGQGNFTATNYNYYRGFFPSADPAAGYYAFPLAVGETITVEPHTIRFGENREREEIYYMSFAIQENDTVYAMRGGVACMVGDKKGVIINHIDETFAVYHHMRKAFVSPGDAVEIGQPIGLAAGGKVYVSFLYLDKAYFKQKEMAEEYPYTHFVPLLWEGTQYVHYEMTASRVVPAIPDELVMQDMSKAQKKRYLKNKKKTTN